MAKFRKKPVVIEAWQLPEVWPGEDTELMPMWLINAYGTLSLAQTMTQTLC